MPAPADFVPGAISFTRSFSITAADIDVLGHANNVAWVRWVQDLATGHSDSLGYDLAAYRRLGLVWVVRRHDIEYLAPAYSGDVVVGTTWVASSGTTSSQRRTRFVRERDQALLVRAETTWVLIDSEKRPTRVPDEMRQAFGST
jgi:acyl-CoA thioester hydrolase